MTTKNLKSDSQIDKETVDFGQQLKEFPKVKIRLHLPMEERQKLEAQESAGKIAEYPTELICLNGYRFEIARGKEVEVPEPIADIARASGLI